MRKSAALVLIGLFVAACGGGPGTTPEATFNAFKSASASKDGKALYDLFAPSVQKAIESKFQQAKANSGNAMVLNSMGLTKDQLDNMSSARDYFGWRVSKASDEAANEAAKEEFVKKEINGDQATVTFKIGSTTTTIPMVRVKGKWYVASLSAL